MVLYEKDGITVQAMSPQEEAEYKRLGFVKVETPKPVEPAEKKTGKKAEPKKDGES